jgi:hypothetical protein
VDLEQELDRLYQAAPTAFVGTRNELVSALRKAGQTADADLVAKLKRPTPVAWAVNQLHFRARPVLDALERAGAALKEVQESLGGSDAFAQAKREHQKALRAAADRALAFAEEHGASTNASTRRSVEMTLNLLSAAPESGPAPGRLTAELAPVGFDSLTIAGAPAAREPKPTPRTASIEEKQHAATLRKAHADGERKVARLEERATETRAHHAKTVKEAEAAITAADDARRARDDARRDAEAAQKELDDARAEVERTRRDLDAADGDSR